MPTANINEQNQVQQIRESAEECSTLDASMALNGDVSNTGVTTFTNEACDGVNAFPSYFGVDGLEVQEDLQDLKRYFERPRLVRRGAFTLGARNNVVDVTWDRSALIAAFPQWNNRLAGAYGIRFTMNFRFQVACTSFHQGLVAMGFQYSDPGNVFFRGGAPFSITNLPHVRLDLTESTMVELKIPFLYMNDFFAILPTSPASGDAYGRMAVTVVLPIIAVTGMSAPTFELYAYLSDIELIAADNAASTTVTLQSGGVVAAEMKQSHLLSRGLATAARITRFVGSNIPSIAGIAGPASWVMDSASGIAKYFGYSRPILQDPSQLMLRSEFVAENNIDVPLTGFVVGPFKGNSLSVSPGFAATDVDEMSFDFIKSQYAQICYGSVNIANAHGDTIYATPVSPSCWWFRAPVSRPFCNIVHPRNSSDITVAGNSIFPSHLMNLSSFFRFWRGGVIFRVTFAKTKFHGGRYMISYNPKLSWQSTRTAFVSVDGPEVDAGLVQPYGYSKIMDLKDGNVFEFHVPFTSECPFIPFHASVGSVTITCIDPLTSSASVTGVVPMLIEIKGDTDYEVADYAGPQFVTQTFGTIYTQSGGDAVVRSVVKDPAPETIGEKMMSVKQIIQTPTWYKYSIGADTNATYKVFPWYTNFTDFTIGGGALPNPTTTAFKGSSCPTNIWGKCYMYAKGGTDIHLYPIEGDIQFSAFHSPNTGSTAYDVTGKDYAFRNLVGNIPRVLSGLSQAIHARFPAFQYARRVQPNALDSIASLWTTSTVTGTTACHYNLVNVNNTATAVGTYIMGRAAADDAALGHYVGPVPYYIPNAASTQPLDTDLL